jgi:hypothetical protein
MKRLIDFKKFIIRESSYIGSCVEVGDANSCNYINKIFSDATDMAYYVGDPDNDDFGQSKEIPKEEFFENVDIKNIKNKQLKGDVGFYYIPNLKIYYIYNFDNGIHYFYK